MFTYIDRKCPECEFIELNLDDNTEKIVLVCGNCDFGFYKD